MTLYRLNAHLDDCQNKLAAISSGRDAAVTKADQALASENLAESNVSSQSTTIERLKNQNWRLTKRLDALPSIAEFRGLQAELSKAHSAAPAHPTAAKLAEVRAELRGAKLRAAVFPSLA